MWSHVTCKRGTHQVGALDLRDVHLQQLVAEGVLREQAPAGARPRAPRTPAALVRRCPALRVHLRMKWHVFDGGLTRILGRRHVLCTNNIRNLTVFS